MRIVAGREGIRHVIIVVGMFSFDTTFAMTFLMFYGEMYKLFLKGLVPVDIDTSFGFFC